MIVVAVVLVVAIIVLYVLSRNKPTPATNEGTATPTGLSDSSQVPPGELPTAQSGGGGGGGAAIPSYDDESGLPIGITSPASTPRTGLSKTPSAVARATKTPTLKPTAFKTPTIGDLDYTKSQPKNEIKISPEVANELSKIQSNPDPCVLSGIQDSWSNPFEKTICGMARFFNDQVLEPLDNLTCNLTGSWLSLNYSSNIKSNMVNGVCQIEDR